VVLGIGMGASISPTQISGVLALPPQRSGLASACINTTRKAGTTLGVAVLGLIVAHFSGFPGTPGYPKGLTHGLHVAAIIAAVATLAVSALSTSLPRRRVS
jgi:DHA2 family methylenomycin A resistance protein-like MFS transporter